MKYDKRKKIISITALIIVIVFILGLIVSPLISTKAVSLSELQKQQQQLEKQQKQNEANIKSNESQQKSTEQQKAAIDSSISNLQQQIDILNAQINAYSVQVRQKQAEITKAQQRIDANYALFKQRMCAMYKAGDVSYLDVLLSSESVTDFLYRYEVISSVATHDTDLLDQLRADKKKVEDDKKQVEQDKASVLSAQSKLAVKQASLQSQSSQQQALIVQLANEHQDLEQASAQLDAEMDAANKAIEKKIREMQSTGNYVGGGFLWPIQGMSTYISSPFGVMRKGHTIAHTGIDIAAGSIYGQPIHAANAGRVTIVEYYGGSKYVQPYGNYIIIDHGGGLSTMYAHQSSFAAGISVGTVVKRGQVIGYVGNTGNSTGPHLHFGVLKNGVFVNPLNYSYAGRS